MTEKTEHYPETRPLGSPEAHRRLTSPDRAADVHAVQ